MTASLPTLDAGQFEALRVFQEIGKADVLAEMVRLFVGEVRGWLVEASDAADSGNVVVMRRVAHSLKGVCGTIGATRMRALAIELEDALAADRLSDAGAVVQALREEFRELGELLRPYASYERGED